MPKKGTRETSSARKCRRVSDASEPGTKHFRSVHIGVSNGRRWLTLKKRLGLQSDEDLALYLLDLADSAVRRDAKCQDPSSNRKKDCDKENDIDRTKGKSVDEPLRRSARKQITESPEPKVPCEPVQPAQPEVDVATGHVRSKHHRSKTKHHKEKRRKKKHRDENSQSDEPSNVDQPQVPPKGESLVEEKNVPELPDTENNKDEEKKSDEGTSEVKQVEEEKKPLESGTNFEKSEEFPLFHDLTTSTAVNGIEEGEKQIFEDFSKSTTPENGSERNLSSEDTKSLLSSEALKENVQNPPQDERKVKKRRKRLKKDGKSEDTVATDEDEEGLRKHRKRKHKHVGEHKNKKNHDVRKAPQDGIIVLQEKKETDQLEDSAVLPDLQSPDETDGSLTEPQRLAIKIKLCQDCNSRHLQDACPLTTPQYKIDDAVTLHDWLAKHRNSQETIKVAKSEDPMSEGYGRTNEEASESEEETNSTEQFKAKSKAEREENVETNDPERPTFARDSLPDCFELKLTNTKHGLGVFVKKPVPVYAKLGPLIGKPIREMDIPDDFSMRHIWEVNTNGATSYLSTTNPVNSNWMRYVRPSYRKEDRTSTVVTNEGELYLITTQNLTIGMELTYWADSQCSAWNRKNKMDKTNCGGCNLNFQHSIYYRLHCWIFHDTNYSLTIRKYHCKVCGAVVLGKDNIVKHAAELHAGRGAYQCQYCKKFFLRLNYLEMHRTYGCSQNPQRSRPLCDFCGRKFCQPQKLKVHIKRMHSDMSEVLREFQCKSCLKLLGSRAALQRHMKEVHHKDVVGAATCDRCGKMFQNKSNLKIHMLTHSGVKPFKCKESGCKAAFTTKQCLQFHYKKVHGLTEEMMPKIERSVAYTFDAYSGGLVEDTGRGKTPRFSQRNSQDNSNSVPSIDDCSSESLRLDTSTNRATADAPNKFDSAELNQESQSSPQQNQSIVPMSSIEAALDPLREDVDLYSGSRIQSKGSKKWLGEFNPPPNPELPSAPADLYEFEEERKELTEKSINSQVMIDETKLSMSVYRRPESTSASLLVEAALDAAEREIGAVSSPILEDTDRETHLYPMSNQLQSPIHSRSPEPHLDSYIQQQDELMSPAPTPDNRHSPPSHLHMDYHLHRPLEYISTSRTHNIEQYLHHEDIQRVSSPNGYIHVQQDELGSPSTTPNPRYQDLHHHHQVPTDNLSSDEGDSVAQNLCLSVKEKSLQLDLSSSYKYDSLDSEFNRERGNFDTLVLNSNELQGLDMSARSYHGFGSQSQNRYHHIYEMSDRQSVDLSRTGGYSIPSPPPPPPPYPHGDVLRVVSLDLTPGGRHTVDLSLSRSHHLHSGSRILASPPQTSSASPHIVPEVLEGRIMSPPPPPLPGYNPTYPVSPAPYHPPRSGYHHYSGYY